MVNGVVLVYVVHVSASFDCFYVVCFFSVFSPLWHVDLSRSASTTSCGRACVRVFLQNLSVCTDQQPWPVQNRRGS